MSGVPPTTLLLWLSLALDTDERFQAEKLMLNLLQSGPCSHISSGINKNSTTGRPGSHTAWTRRQYLTLLHLYVIEVLLPALRDPSEVRLWLQRQSFLPLDPREIQFLEDEVVAAAAGSGGAQSGGGGECGASCDTLRRRADSSYMPHTPGDRANLKGSGDVLSDGGLGGGENEEDLSMHRGMALGHGTDFGLSPVPSPLPFGPTDPTSPLNTTRRRWQQPQQQSLGGSTRSDRVIEDQQNINDSVTELDWLGSAQQAAFTAAEHLYQHTYAAAGRAWKTMNPNSNYELPTSSKESTHNKIKSANNTHIASSSYTTEGKGEKPLSPSLRPEISTNSASDPPLLGASSAAGAAAMVIFACAAYSERDVLGRAAQRAWRGVGRILGDLVGSGLFLNPNPMASSAMRGPL